MKSKNSSITSRDIKIDSLLNNRENNCKNPPASNKNEDVEKLIVMSGTAKRKKINQECNGRFAEEKTESCVVQGSYREEFLKLRVPYCKPRNKQVPTEEKLMNRSCEILLECLKPYKNVIVAKKTQTVQSNVVSRSTMKTEENFQNMATRKVQFISICEETPMPLFTKSFLYDEMMREKCFILNPKESVFENELQKENSSPKSKKSRKTISSEDFITTV